MSRITRRSIIPVNQITPLTYRDGVTYIQLLTELSEYIKTVLHPSLQHTVDQLVADVEAQIDKAHDQYVDGVQEFQRIHDAFMSDVNASLIALNDGAVTDLVNDGTSKLGSTLRDIFATHGDFEQFRDDTTRRFNTFESTTNKRFDTFESTTNKRFDDFKSTIDTSVENIRDGLRDHENQAQQQFTDVHGGLRRLQKFSGQTDFVSMLSAASNISSLQIRKSGRGDGASFEISFINEARGTYVSTSFNSGSVQATNDDYHRVYETWSGSLGSKNSDGYYYTNREYLMAPKSNWEFAYRFRPAGYTDTDYQWIPEHNNTPTAFFRSIPVVRDGQREIPIYTASNGDRWVTTDFLELTQRVYGRHPATGSKNLFDIITKHKYTMDGRIIVTGSITALSDVEFFSGYHLMFPGGEDIDLIHTSFGNTIIPRRDGSTQTLSEESNIATSYAMTSTQHPTNASAVKILNPSETLLWDVDRSGSQRAFVDHRESSIVKVYNQLYDRGHVMKAGEVHRFHGEYAFVESSLVRSLLGD